MGLTAGSEILGVKGQKFSIDALKCAIAEGGEGEPIELVFTAHPTEIARRTLIQKYNRIARTLARRDRPDLTAADRDALDVP